MMPVSRFCSTVFALMAATIVVGLMTPIATAEPAPDPCAQSGFLLCRMLPIYPDLEEDIDLTKPAPAEAPLDPAVEPGPIAPGTNTE